MLPVWKSSLSLYNICFAAGTNGVVDMYSVEESFEVGLYFAEGKVASALIYMS